MSNYCSNCGSSAFDGASGSIVGWSTRANDPEILAAMKKNKKATMIFAAVLIPLPLAGLTIYSLVSDKMELRQGILYGAIVSLIFLFCTVVSAIKKKTSKPYEAVVIDKKTRQRSNHNQDHAHYYTEYITYAQTTDGKKKKIIEREGSMITAYHYLNVGDRFKYHNQFNIPYYELYDKTNAPYIPCVSCGTKNSVQSDRCCKCNIPLLK